MEIRGLPLDGRLMVTIAAVLVAGFLRGFVGFGAALVIVPVLSLAYGPLVAIPALTPGRIAVQISAAILLGMGRALLLPRVRLGYPLAPRPYQRSASHRDEIP